MPARDVERFVSAAVESVLAQDWEDFEFLIFDDGSTDGTLPILRSYARKDSRVQVFAGSHRGYVPWLNTGIRMSRGEFVARMDADDISMPQRFKRQVEFLTAHEECVAVGSFHTMIDPDGQPLGQVQFDTASRVIKENLLNGALNVICHPAVMMRRSVLVAVGGYREDCESVEDFALWLDLAERGALANIPEFLFNYRQHHSSVSATQHERQIRLAREILRKARHRIGLEPLGESLLTAYTPARSPAERHREWALTAASSGYRRTALKHARVAIRLAPHSPLGWLVLFRCLTPRDLVIGSKAIGLSRIWRRLHRRGGGS
jgi:glycosyltransferase involved in cell wall biosynthesis